MEKASLFLRAIASGLGLALIVGTEVYELDPIWLVVAAGLVVGVLLARFGLWAQRRTAFFERYWIVPLSLMVLGSALQNYAVVVIGLVALAFLTLHFFAVDARSRHSS